MTQVVSDSIFILSEQNVNDVGRGVYVNICQTGWLFAANVA